MEREKERSRGFAFSVFLCIVSFQNSKRKENGGIVQLPEKFKDVELIILDMDGVITSEQAYWDAAGLVVRDILESPVFLGLSQPDYTPIANLFYRRLVKGYRLESRKYLPTDLISKCKSRGINSNWDLAYLVTGLYLTHLIHPFQRIHQSLFQTLPHPTPMRKQMEEIPVNLIQHCLSPILDRLKRIAQDGEWERFFHLRDFHLWGDYLRRQKKYVSQIKQIELNIIDDFHPNIRGIQLLDELNLLVNDPQTKKYHLFGRNSILWDECRDLFQQWYLGEDLYRTVYGAPIQFTPKPGLIHHEEPLNGLEKTHAALTKLKEAGFTLGIATGRPRMEILTPLQEWNMLRYFDIDHVVTHDDVEQAEHELKTHRINTHLGKPHPFAFIKAVHPARSTLDLYKMCQEPIPYNHRVLVVGDATADIWAAKKMGCLSVALLSGVMGQINRHELEETKPDLICNHFIELSEALSSYKHSIQTQ